MVNEHDLTEYKELREDILSWVASLAQDVIVHNRPVSDGWAPAGRDPTDLEGMIIGFMTEVGDPNGWSAQMLNVLKNSLDHYGQARKFVKRAGKELRSNFGLRFDPDSGLDYK